MRREGIELTGSFTATVNAELKVGALEETITVSGQSPIVDTRNVVQQRVLSDEVREALPTGRSVQMMAQIIPGITQNPVSRPSGQDVGGLSGERGTLMIHGSRATDFRLEVDGSSVNIGSTGGNAAYNLNPTEAQEFVYELGGLSAETVTGGIRVNVIPKEGGNRFSGQVMTAYVTDGMQSQNLTDELRAQGLQAGNDVEKTWDYNFALGGPIKKDSLWFFLSYRDWGVREKITGMFRPIDPLSFTFDPRLGAAGNVDLTQRKADGLSPDGSVSTARARSRRPAASLGVIENGAGCAISHRGPTTSGPLSPPAYKRPPISNLQNRVISL